MVVLVGLVGDNVDWTMSASYVIMVVRQTARQHTKHVPLPVLTATLVGNVGRDTHVGKSQILDREICRIQTTDGREATAVVDGKADLLQLLAKAG